MKISQKMNNQVKKKLCAKSFINSKNEESLLDNSNKKTKGKYILKNSGSTKRNLRKYDSKEKYNTLKENYQIKQKINLSKKSNDNKNNKKRSVIIHKINLNKKLGNEIENQNKTDFIYNEIKEENNRSINDSTMNTYKNSGSVKYNKTINNIRIKNPKLNNVLYSINENKNLKEKPFNYCLSIRNYYSLSKNNIKNKTLNYSINKGINKEDLKRINNSFRIKQNNNKNMESIKLKIKLKKNNSIEKGYVNFYKINKKFVNQKKMLNKTLMPNYTCPINIKEDLKNKEKNKGKNYISISKNNKEKELKNNSNEKKAKNTKKLDFDVLKLKIENCKNNILNEINAVKETNDIKEKIKTKLPPSSSKSAHKRNIIKKKIDTSKNILKKKLNQKKNQIKRRNNDLNSNIQYNSEVITDSKIKINKFIKIVNNNKINKENNNKNEDSNMTTIGNFNTLPNSDIFDINVNSKNYNIFEIISDVKVKSILEYEEDKKNSKIKGYKKQANKSYDINENNSKKDTISNININELLNEKKENNKSKESISNDYSNDNEDKDKNEKFIEDRDEYNIELKETFSKDRFSFRPTNNDSKETFQDSKFTSDNTLDKKDFLKNFTSKLNFGNNLKIKIPVKKQKKQLQNIKANDEKSKKLIKLKSKDLKNNKK
jgi:hypothetical protein